MTPAQLFRAINAKRDEYQRNGELLAVVLAPIANLWSGKNSTIRPYHLFPTENLKPAEEKRTEQERKDQFQRKVDEMGPRAVEVKVI